MLDLTQDGNIARLTLNRPAKRNAVTVAMWQDFPKAIDEVTRSQATRVVVLSGAGGHFSSGADIGEFEEIYATAETALNFARVMAASMQAVSQCPKPVIAQIHGACVGGGCGLALACDIRLAGKQARLGITPGRLGLAYSLADTKRLSDAVGFSRARMLLYTGRIVTAAQALSYGLVDEVVEDTDLPEAVTALAQEIAESSTLSAVITKATLAQIAKGASEDTKQTQDWFQQALRGPDFAKARSAFLEKRKPIFT